MPRKIVYGYVIQDFEDGKCVAQSFEESDHEEYENDAGEFITESPGNHPIELVQPR